MLNALVRAMFYFILREWRSRYPGALALVGEVFAFVLTLAVYWYTARAFSGQAGFAGGDYFSYVVLGEASLMLPLGIMSGLLNSAREAQGEGVLEALLTLPWSGTRTLVILGFPGLLREGTRALALLVAAWAIGMPLTVPKLAGWLMLELSALPIFIGLGLACVASFFRFGRGEAVIHFAGTIATIVAGAYFPVALLPETLRRLAAHLSPFSVLLDGCRAVFGDGAQVLQGRAMEWLILGGALVLPLALLAAAGSLNAIRRRGSFELT